MDFAEDLDLELAWRKAKRDYSHYLNSFTSSPYIPDILDNNEADWLDDLRCRLENREYEPRTPRQIDVPKKNFHLRPASILHPEDLVVYSAIILEEYEKIKKALDWSAKECRYSHILRDDPTESNQWDEFEKPLWTEMSDKKINYAAKFDYVLETDISGYYENIDIERTTSTFKQITGRQDLGNELRHLLRPWAKPRNRGLPQGYSPSDVLAEIYLDSIDKHMVNSGYTHIRYNDDFFVFCNSFDEAVEAQNILEREFRIRGLNMKSGKTDILKSDDAFDKYLEPGKTIQELKRKIGEDDEDDWLEDLKDSQNTDRVSEANAEASSYAASAYVGDEDDAEEVRGDGGEISDEDHIVELESQEEDEEDLDDLSEVLEEAYREYIEDVKIHDLDIHIFRYVVNRLGKLEDDIAVDYCIDYIKKGGGDARRVLYNYFRRLDEIEEIAVQLAKGISNNEYRYAFHEFVVVRWLFEQSINEPEIIHAARQFLERGDTPPETLQYACAILSEYGEYSDWERIEMLYPETALPQTALLNRC